MAEGEQHVCFYCGTLVRGKWGGGNLEWDHFPIPADVGGKNVVPCCRSCHDMKDRYDIGKWPAEWIKAILLDFPDLRRETRLFLARAMGAMARAIRDQKKEKGPEKPRDKSNDGIENLECLPKAKHIRRYSPLLHGESLAVRNGDDGYFDLV